MTITAAGFIAITADDQPIWGAGATITEAIREAMQYGASNINAEDRDEYARDLCTMPATRNLIEQVEDMGGDLSWDEVDGIACTMAEHEVMA